MKRDFIINRQGKDYVLYAGLLDEAHEKGLDGIQTELLQAPGPANGETAICRATVTMKDGRVFTGIGDANPVNVSKNIAPHAIRMAETRSKARALRDALNVNAVSVEEMLDLDEEPPPDPRRAKAIAQRVSMEQMVRLEVLCARKRGWDKEETHRRLTHAYKIEDLSWLPADIAASAIAAMEKEPDHA